MKTIILLTLLFPVISFGHLEEPCHGAKGKAHPKGGGFVADTARAFETTYIGSEAQVCDKVQVSGNALVSGRTRLYETQE